MAGKRQPAWEIEQQKSQDRLRQLWYRLTSKIQSPEVAGPNPNPMVGPNALPDVGINPSGMSIPLVGADMGDRASALVREWAKGAENIPFARSMIGMMSGDAGKDIAAARAAAGPNPMDDYISPKYKEEHPEWGAKQEQRMQEYQQRAGKELGEVTGLEGGYDPMSGGKEWEEISTRGLTPEQVNNREQWLEAMKKYFEKLKKAQQKAQGE